MTHDASGVALLQQCGVDVERVRGALDAIVRPGRATLPPGAERPYTSRTRQAIGYAAESAGVHGESMVGVAHLIVGLLRERLNLGAGVLQQHGLTAERAAALE
jgi:ATP-dependent Clp protease ATP-binding subunit ClpA